MENTTEYLYIIPAVATLCILLSTLSFNKFLTAINLVILWWSFWLFISNLSITGIYIPSATTQNLILLFIVAYTVGSILGRKITLRNHPFVINNQQNLINEKTFHERATTFLNFIQPLIIIILAPVFLRSLLLLNSGQFLNYRREIFSLGDGKISILYQSVAVEALYNVIVYPLLYLTILIAAVLLIVFGKKKFFIIAIATLFIKITMTLGRSELYECIVILSVILIIYRKKSFAIVKTGKAKIKRQLLLFSSLFIIGILSTSFYRATAISKVFTSFGHDILKYHNCGFVLLDLEIKNINSYLNNNLTYGRGFLAGLDYIFTLSIRRIDRDYIGLQSELTHLDYMKTISPDSDQANAYYTIIYYLYLDGRIFVIILVPLVLGFISSGSYKAWMRHRDFWSLFVLVILTSALMMSIFNYPGTSPKLWVALPILFFVSKGKNYSRLLENTQIKTATSLSTINEDPRRTSQSNLYRD